MKILVVDDDQTSRQLLARALERAGYDVTGARDGSEALQFIQDAGPALLVLDYEMPGFTGAQVCEIVRRDSNPEIAQLPIILLTAHTGEAHEVECLRAGANDFVSKPVNAAVLGARIETHLRLHALQQQLREQNAELEAQRELRELDLEAARLTQAAIIPARLPVLPGWEWAAHYQPVIQVGGDMYDWDRMADGSMFFWVADATGHGSSAALLTTLAKLLFRRAVSEAASPAAILRLVNEEFYGIFKGRTFMTVLGAALQPATGELRIVGAGHPPLLVRRANGGVESVASVGPPLGVQVACASVERIVRLDPGDSFVLYTDGFYGMANAAGLRLEPAALEGFLSAGPAGAGPLLRHLLGEISLYAGGQPFPDDLAALSGHWLTSPSPAQ